MRSADALPHAVAGELSDACRVLARLLQPLIFAQAVQRRKHGRIVVGERAVFVNGEPRPLLQLQLTEKASISCNVLRSDAELLVPALQTQLWAEELQGWLDCFSCFLRQPLGEEELALLVDGRGRLLSPKLGNARGELQALFLAAWYRHTPPRLADVAQLDAVRRFYESFLRENSLRARETASRTPACEVSTFLAEVVKPGSLHRLSLSGAQVSDFLPNRLSGGFARKDRAERGSVARSTRRSVLAPQCTIEQSMAEPPPPPPRHHPSRFIDMPKQRSQVETFEGYVQAKLFSDAPNLIDRQSVMASTLMEFIPAGIELESRLWDVAEEPPVERVSQVTVQPSPADRELGECLRLLEQRGDWLEGLAGEWNFNALELSLVELSSLCLMMMQPFLSALGATPAETLLVIIRLRHYYAQHDNAYHNFFHAVTVLHAAHFFLYSHFLEDLTELERASFLIAALGHDADHTGYSNNFEVLSKSELAMVYNDSSPLENHHVHMIFKVLNAAEVGFVQAMPAGDYWRMREFIVDVVLATDMKLHFKLLEQLEAMTDCFPPKRLRCCLALHAADLSGSVKSSPVSLAWSKLVNAEFYAQYLREKELGVKETPNYRNLDQPRAQLESEINFVRVILLPFYQTLNGVDKHQRSSLQASGNGSAVLPERRSFDLPLANSHQNLELYKEMLAEMKEREAAGDK